MAYKAVIIDSGLDAAKTGLEICQQTTHRTTPVLFPPKDTVNDRVQGLDAGADDYLVKPLNYESY